MYESTIFDQMSIRRNVFRPKGCRRNILSTKRPFNETSVVETSVDDRLNNVSLVLAVKMDSDADITERAHSLIYSAAGRWFPLGTPVSPTSETGI